MEDCVFCKIVNREIESTIIKADNDFLAFKNIRPVAEHHYLVCPKRHIETFLDIDSELNMNRFVEFMQGIVKEKNIANGYKLVFNGGKYQSVPHLHWHLLAGKLENGNDILNQT